MAVVKLSMAAVGRCVDENAAVSRRLAAGAMESVEPAVDGESGRWAGSAVVVATAEEDIEPGNPDTRLLELVFRRRL